MSLKVAATYTFKLETGWIGYNWELLDGEGVIVGLGWTLTQGMAERKAVEALRRQIDQKPNPCSEWITPGDKLIEKVESQERADRVL